MEQLGFLRHVNEQQVKANADWMAQHLKAYGWQYITVDMEWFVTDPKPEGNAKDSHYQIDPNGRFQPAVNRFPSAKDGAGFKPLADYVHALGLKFGIHILQGVPRSAVKDNLPIADSQYHASDAANKDGTCGWNYDYYDLKHDAAGQAYYDLKHDAAGQAYYDSIAKMHAGWGVDLIKVDCIAFGPFKGEEIQMLSAALQKTGRPIVLSLSPGPTPVDKEAEVERYATMWRISNDVWDIWQNTEVYPQGLNDQFSHVATWASAPRSGHYPDADMLPLGYLGPAPGWVQPRQTRLTHDEQKSFLTLWGIFRSPLMMEGDLPHNEVWTTALLTNREFLDVDQHARNPKAVVSTESESVWTSEFENGAGHYVAIFNRSEQRRTLHYSWVNLGMGEGVYQLRDLWDHKDLGPAKEIDVILAPHASVLYRVQAK
jgi:alpha-galactosidase